ncbi:MAG: hypothetical protein MZU97_19265 [Bacillus subtilis]|nr:hypothetical protein [Bacillus subtilis]
MSQAFPKSDRQSDASETEKDDDGAHIDCFDRLHQLIRLSRRIRLGRRRRGRRVSVSRREPFLERLIAKRKETGDAPIVRMSATVDQVAARQACRSQATPVESTDLAVRYHGHPLDVPRPRSISTASGEDRVLPSAFLESRWRSSKSEGNRQDDRIRADGLRMQTVVFAHQIAWRHAESAPKSRLTSRVRPSKRRVDRGVSGSGRSFDCLVVDVDPRTRRHLLGHRRLRLSMPSATNVNADSSGPDIAGRVSRSALFPSGTDQVLRRTSKTKAMRRSGSANPSNSPTARPACKGARHPMICLLCGNGSEPHSLRFGDAFEHALLVCRSCHRSYRASRTKSGAIPGISSGPLRIELLFPDSRKTTPLRIGKPACGIESGKTAEERALSQPFDEYDHLSWYDGDWSNCMAPIWLTIASSRMARPRIILSLFEPRFRCGWLESKIREFCVIFARVAFTKWFALVL